MSVNTGMSQRVSAARGRSEQACGCWIATEIAAESESRRARRPAISLCYLLVPRLVPAPSLEFEFDPVRMGAPAGGLSPEGAVCCARPGLGGGGALLVGISLRCTLAYGVLFDAGLSVPGTLLSVASPEDVLEGGGVVVEGILAGGGFLAGMGLSTTSPSLELAALFSACAAAKGMAQMAETRRSLRNVVMSSP